MKSPELLRNFNLQKNIIKNYYIFNYQLNIFDIFPIPRKTQYHIKTEIIHRKQHVLNNRLDLNVDDIFLVSLGDVRLQVIELASILCAYTYNIFNNDLYFYTSYPKKKSNVNKIYQNLESVKDQLLFEKDRLKFLLNLFYMKYIFNYNMYNLSIWHKSTLLLDFNYRFNRYLKEFKEVKKLNIVLFLNFFKNYKYSMLLKIKKRYSIKKWKLRIKYILICIIFFEKLYEFYKEKLYKLNIVKKIKKLYKIKKIKKLYKIKKIKKLYKINKIKNLKFVKVRIFFKLWKKLKKIKKIKNTKKINEKKINEKKLNEKNWKKKNWMKKNWKKKKLMKKYWMKKLKNEKKLKKKKLNEKKINEKILNEKKIEKKKLNLESKFKHDYNNITKCIDLNINTQRYKLIHLNKNHKNNERNIDTFINYGNTPKISSVQKTLKTNKANIKDANIIIEILEYLKTIDAKSDLDYARVKKITNNYYKRKLINPDEIVNYINNLKDSKTIDAKSDLDYARVKKITNNYYKQKLINPDESVELTKIVKNKRVKLAKIRLTLLLNSHWVTKLSKKLYSYYRLKKFKRFLNAIKKIKKKPKKKLKKAKRLYRLHKSKKLFFKKAKLIKRLIPKLFKFKLKYKKIFNKKNKINKKNKKNKNNKINKNSIFIFNKNNKNNKIKKNKMFFKRFLKHYYAVLFHKRLIKRRLRRKFRFRRKRRRIFKFWSRYRHRRRLRRRLKFKYRLKKKKLRYKSKAPTILEEYKNNLNLCKINNRLNYKILNYKKKDKQELVDEEIRLKPKKISNYIKFLKGSIYFNISKKKLIDKNYNVFLNRLKKKIKENILLCKKIKEKKKFKENLNATLSFYLHKKLGKYRKRNTKAKNELLEDVLEWYKRCIKDYKEVQTLQKYKVKKKYRLYNILLKIFFLKLRSLRTQNSKLIHYNNKNNVSISKIKHNNYVLNIKINKMLNEGNKMLNLNWVYLKKMLTFKSQLIKRKFKLNKYKLMKLKLKLKSMILRKKQKLKEITFVKINWRKIAKMKRRMTLDIKYRELKESVSTVVNQEQKYGKKIKLMVWYRNFYKGLSELRKKKKIGKKIKKYRNLKNNIINMSFVDDVSRFDVRKVDINAICSLYLSKHLFRKILYKL